MSTAQVRLVAMCAPGLIVVTAACLAGKAAMEERASLTRFAGFLNLHNPTAPGAPPFDAPLAPLDEERTERDAECLRWAAATPGVREKSGVHHGPGAATVAENQWALSGAVSYGAMSFGGDLIVWGHAGGPALLRPSASPAGGASTRLGGAGGFGGGGGGSGAGSGSGAPSAFAPLVDQTVDRLESAAPLSLEPPPRITVDDPAEGAVTVVEPPASPAATHPATPGAPNPAAQPTAGIPGGMVTVPLPAPALMAAAGLFALIAPRRRRSINPPAPARS